MLRVEVFCSDKEQAVLLTFCVHDNSLNDQKRGKVFARHPWCQYFLASQYAEEPQMVSFQLLRFPTLSPFGASLFLDLGRLWSFEEPEEKGKMWKGLSICLLRMEVIYFWLSSYCRSLTKVKFSTDQVRPAIGSGSWLSMVNYAQKPENGPISDLFNLTQNTFCLYCLVLT